MRLMLGIIISVFIILFGSILLLLFLRTYQMQHNQSAKIFLEGKVPTTMPEGLFSGKVSFKTSWQGKKFDSKNKTGVNVFKNGGTVTENYPFKTYVGKGTQDNIEVLKIDYSGNKKPWWLRFILDEVVEIKPEHYLGKVHLTIIPYFPFTLGYFELKK